MRPWPQSSKRLKATQSDSKWLYVLWLDVFLASFDAAASGFWYILGTRMWWRIFTMMGAFGLALSISQEGAISLLGSSGAIWSLQRGWRMAEKVWKGDPAKVFNTYCISLAYCIPIHHNYIYSWLATATAFCVWANGQHNEGSRAKACQIPRVNQNPGEIKESHSAALPWTWMLMNA